MSSIRLKTSYYNTLAVEVPLGSRVDEAFSDACRLAQLLQCRVDFEFNGTPVHAYPNSICQELLDKWKEDSADW